MADRKYERSQGSHPLYGSHNAARSRSRQAYQGASQTYRSGQPGSYGRSTSSAYVPSSSKGMHARVGQMPQRPHGQQQVDVQGLSRYSYMPPKRKRSHKIAFRVGMGVAVIVLAAIGFAVGYMLRLDSAMNLGDRKESIMEVLEPAAANEPFYVLLIGSDSREGALNSDADWAGVSADGSDQHADVIMLARVDTSNDQISLLSIPRDTPWTFGSNTFGKLNYTYTVGGIPYLVQAVNELTDLPISHVVEIHMSGLIDMVDLIGGIEVNVPSRIDYHEALTSQDVVIEPGLQTLNGIQTEVFARERLSLADGDASRQSNVRTVIEAILKKVKNLPINELPGTIMELAECVDTDFATFDVVQLLMGLGTSFTLYQGSVPSDGAENPYTSPANQWLCYDNPAGWERVLTVFKSGGDPGTVSYEGDATTVATPKSN